MGQTTSGLANDGKTGRYAISYDTSLPEAEGLSMAQGLMGVCDQDFDNIAGWFAGTDFQFSLPVNVQLNNAGGGASWNDPPNISLPFGYSPTVQINAVMTPPETGLDFVRYLLVSEVTEMFMASKDNGWYEPTSLFSGANEGSKGEGLSRFLGAQFNLGWAGDAHYPPFDVVSLWLNSPTRPNYVDNNPDDINPDVITGCTTCFLYYLHDQLKYGITDIINAGAATLGVVYQKLTGRSDGWQSFIDLANLHYPLGRTYRTPGDNPFPVPNLAWLSGSRVVAGSTVQAYVNLDKKAPADVTITLGSDNPGVVSVPATVVVPAGEIVGLVDLQAAPVVGPEQSVTIHASYAGQSLTAQVNVLPRASVLAGVVTDAAGTPLGTDPYDTAVLVDGLPLITGVHMDLSTGSDGSYSTGPVSAGTYQIEASAAEHVTAQTTVTVEEGVPTTEVNFALEKTLPFTVSGTVTDPSRAPIAGASVTLIQNGDDSRILTTTDAAGGYRLSQDPGEYTGDYTLVVTHPGYTVGESVITIPNGATVPEDFVLARLGSMTGLVTDSGQTPALPIPNATLQAGAVVASSDTSGRYQMVLAPGPTAVTVGANGFESQTVTVVVAGDTTNHDFALVEATATLTGTVLDGDSQYPLYNATVAVAGARTVGHADSDGAYTVLGVPAGHARVTVRAPHYLSMELGIDFAAHQTVSRDFDLFNHPPDPHPP